MNELSPETAGGVVFNLIETKQSERSPQLKFVIHVFKYEQVMMRGNYSFELSVMQSAFGGTNVFLCAA